MKRKKKTLQIEMRFYGGTIKVQFCYNLLFLRKMFMKSEFEAYFEELIKFQKKLKTKTKSIA